MYQQLQRPLALRLQQWHWVAFDALGAALAAALVFITSSRWGRSAYGVPEWCNVALILLVTAPLAVRRRWPMAVFWVVLSAGAVGSAIDVVPGVFGFIADAFVLYMVGLRVSGRRSAVALVAAVIAVLGDVAVYLTFVFTHGGAFAAVSMETAIELSTVGIIAVSGGWATGAAMRQQRAYTQGLREQAAHRAVADERLRIARELHDVVSHSMSVIAIEASVANYVADTEPAAARRALADIESTSQGALRELRHLLGVLRVDTDAATEGPATLTPAPGLIDVSRLIDETDRAGVRVRLRIVGDIRPLPSGVDLSAYRIVQEALTNVIKHAGPAQSTVTVEYRPSEVSVEVTDDGPGPAPTHPPGHGLIGMRERVELYGGTLTAGPLPDHGFRIHATIPIVGDA